jgi:hypothetical protein
MRQFLSASSPQKLAPFRHFVRQETDQLFLVLLPQSQFAIMSKNVYVPEDTKIIAPQYSLEDLDADTYPEASVLPPEERSRIVDRQGKTIPENQETTGPSGRVIIAALDFTQEEHVAVGGLFLADLRHHPTTEALPRFSFA